MAKTLGRTYHVFESFDRADLQEQVDAVLARGGQTVGSIAVTWTGQMNPSKEPVFLYVQAVLSPLQTIVLPDPPPMEGAS